MKKIISAMICIILALSMFACGNVVDAKKIEKIKDGSLVSLDISAVASKTIDITEFVSENDKTVTYAVKSTNTSIATTSAVTNKKFVITAVAVGSTSITLTAKEGDTEVVITFSVVVSDSAPTVDLSYREVRRFEELPLPSKEIREDELPSAAAESLYKIGDTFSMLSGEYRLDFEKANNKFVPKYVSLRKLAGINAISSVKQTPSTLASVVFTQTKPANATISANGAKNYSAAYDSVEQKPYGYLAKATISTDNASRLVFEDRYYFADENEKNSFIVRKTLRTESVKAADKGFASNFVLSANNTSKADTEWFVPNRIYKNYAIDNKDESTYRETQLGLAMAMMYDKSNKVALSISRYQPVIHYDDNSYASVTVLKSDYSSKPAVEIAYPSRDGGRRYHDAKNGDQHVFDIAIRGDVNDSYDIASAESYNAHFNLQNQRIVDTGIDEVYKVVNVDFEEFLHKREQKKEGSKYYSYGLPWRIHIGDPSHTPGQIGPLSYQAGFVGQQIPAGYNMMNYGIMNNDLISLQNGVNVLDFWVDGASFMTPVGIPRIWYNVDQNSGADVGGFKPYPTFTRMAVDCMEGLLDGYRIAEAHGIEKPNWYDSIVSYADFLVDFQNSDGSWYRCYNLDGGPYKFGDNGINEAGEIYQSESKENTTMPVRYLARMYELTGDERYKDAAVTAGAYILKSVYPQGYYRGGTCDNPNKIDKESGVFAMYCFDALYSLTNDTKWIECLKQATAFTISTSQAFSFPTKASSFKAGYPLQYGYNDGVSFISSVDNGIDNYIAYTYFQLFRNYVITGEKTYLKQAEFIQQNTKSIMDWDGKLGYTHKSLLAEASTIYNFNFASADNGVWLPWSSVANAEPIAKMYDTFGKGDVMAFSNIAIEELRKQMAVTGVGGKPHRVYENTVADKVKYEVR